MLAYTFGSLLLVAAIAAWAIAWVAGAISVFRRYDIGAGGKAVWLIVFLVLPVVGLLSYHLWDAARPRSF
jgi:hypothetical protein